MSRWRWLRQRAGGVGLLVVVAVLLSAAHPIRSGAAVGGDATDAGLVGACCLIDGTCIEVTESECASLLGSDVYHGDGTLCSGVACAEVVGVGSCCFPSGTCACCLPEAFCVLNNGVYHESTICPDVVCTTQGACCLPDASCIVIEEPECQAASGVFTSGFAPQCGGLSCIGACCLDSDCTRVTEQECTSIGGTYYGDGTVCMFEPCVTSGACCLPSGSCEETAETQCVVEMGGAFFADLECPGTPHEVLIGSTTSVDLEGDLHNIKLLVDVATAAGTPGSPIDLTRVSWDVTIQVICPGWLDHVRIGIGDDIGDNTVVFAPGAGDMVCSTMSYAGSQDVTLNLTDGVAVLEFFESIDNRPNLPDALYLAGSKLTFEYGSPCIPARVLNTTRITFHPTIQEAIDLADSNDELMVLPGVYHELIDFDGKAVTVQGLSGDPVDVIIEGDDHGPVVTMGPDADGVLRAVTVRGADVPEGDIGGSGILVNGSTPLIDNCIITANFGINGGGIRVLASSGPTIYRTSVVQNSASEHGGGLYLADGATAWVLSSTFSGNFAELGGAVHVGNAADATIKRTVLRGNVVTVDGSAVECQGGEVSLTSCLIYGNSGLGPADASTGAALDNRLGEMIVINCTVVHNFGLDTGGLHAVDGQTLLANTIIRGNDPLSQMIISGGLVEINHCNVQGGTPVPSYSSFDADPMFVDPPNDYRLKAGSPCVNAGGMGHIEVCPPECVAVPAYPPRFCLDLDDATRIRACRVDMGAYESAHFADCNDNGVSDSCDVTPVYGFLCTETLDLGQLPGNSSAYSVFPSQLTVVGNNDGGPGPSVAWKGMALPITGGTLDFFMGYSSEDSDCGSSGSWDFPVFVINGLFFGMNHDGTLSDATAMDCDAAGTINNGDPGAREFRVFLDYVAGPGPYEVGIGVVSVDNQGGAGTVTFSEFFAENDLNRNGVPDECDCPWDVDGDYVASFADILEIIVNWGPCPPGPCRMDVNDNGEVDFADIFEVILNWGACFPPP